MLDEERIDVGEADEQATEIDLDAPAPEQSLEEEEVQVEQVSACLLYTSPSPRDS